MSQESSDFQNPEEMYLELNTDDDTAVELIRNSIDAKEPFAYTRFGDGEILLLNRVFPNEEVKNRVLSNWGFTSSQSEMAFDMFYPILKRGIESADLIGIMDPANMKNMLNGLEFSKEKWSLKYSKLNEMGMDPTRRKVADHQLPRKAVMGDIHRFKKVLGNSSLHIISPYVEGLKSNKIDKILGVEVGYTSVPLEMKLYDRDELFDSVLKIKEQVVVYGCAAGCKDLAFHLKKQGKVALDFGATVGAWAGIAGRPWFKEGGSQHYCLIENP